MASKTVTRSTSEVVAYESFDCKYFFYLCQSVHVLTLRTWRDVSSNLFLLLQPTFGSSLCCPVPSKLSVMNPACTLAYAVNFVFPMSGLTFKLYRASNFDTLFLSRFSELKFMSSRIIF